MRPIFLVLVLLFSLNFCHGQSALTVIVYDTLSQEVLPFANVMLISNQKGNATDIEGICKIDLGENVVKEDTLHCSYIGFRTEKVPIKLPIQDTLILKLSPNTQYLNEILISEKKESLSGKALVQNAVKNIKNNYARKTIELETFYREKLYENNKLVEINESINHIVYAKYPQKGYVRKSFRQYWDNKQKWQKEEGDLLLIGTPQFFKYYNAVEDECYVNTKRISANLSDPKIQSHISGGPLALTAIDKVKYLADFFDSKLLNKYEYYRKDAVFIDSVLCIGVGFRPKIAMKTVFQTWNKKMGFPLYSGTIYVSKNDFAVVKFECQFARNNQTIGYQIDEPWQIYPNTISIEVDYNKALDDKWVLHSVKTSQVIKANSSMKWTIPQNYTCQRELIITDIKGKSDTLSQEHLLQDIYNARLRSFPSKYDSSIWNKFDKKEILPLSTKELGEIEQYEKLVEQFTTDQHNE